MKRFAQRLVLKRGQKATRNDLFKYCFQGLPLGEKSILSKRFVFSTLKRTTTLDENEDGDSRKCFQKC